MDKDSISMFIANIIADELKRVYKDYSVKIIDSYDVVNPTYRIQWWIDEEFKRIFIYYSLEYIKSNEFLKYLSEPSELYFRINSRIVNETHEFIHYYPELLPPAIKVMEGERILNNSDASFNLIRPYTFTYWYCDGKWRFLENYNRYFYNFYKLMIESPKDSKDKIHQFEKDVLELNTKYNFYTNDEEVFKAGFEEFSKLYESYFGTKLKVISEEDINKFYIVIYT